MPFTLTMPKLSPTMEAGTVVKWHKKEGDFVKPGDVLFEVATDKATVEHTALDEGFLRKILVKDGKEARVNEPLAVFTEKKDESIEGYVPEGIAPAPVPATPVAAAPAAATPTPQVTTVRTSAVFTPEQPLEGYQFEGARGAPAERIMASPLARRLAKERNIDLSTVKGTGPHGRILSRDLELGQPEGLVTFSRREAPTMTPGTYEEEPLTPMRRIIAQRLQDAKSTVPHFYVAQDVRVDALVQLHLQLKEGGLKVTYTDFIVRACALALREHPEMNAGFNGANASLIRFKTIDISVAVSVPGGLITPILRHADFRSVGEIGTLLKSLAEKARAGKLAREEYMGGSFTISNLGMFGVSDFIAVINPPQAAILAIGGIEEKAVVTNGKIEVGKVMRLTLSCDHRVVDGTDAARFIKRLQKLLESPALLIV